MNDKVALITGARSGIGRATAEAFAATGAKVVLAARRQEELASLVTEIEARGFANALDRSELRLGLHAMRFAPGGINAKVVTTGEKNSSLFCNQFPRN